MITNNEYKVLSAIPKCIKNVNGHDVAHEDDVISNVTCSEAISEVEAAAAFSNLEIRSLIELPDLGRHEYSITSDGHIAISEYEDNERQKKDEELQAALVRDRENEARNLYSPPQLTYAEGALLDCIMTIFINRQGKNGGIPWIPIGDIKVNMDNHLAPKDYEMPETAISLRGKGLIGIQGPMIYNTETGMVDIPADKITTASIAIQPRPVDCCVALAHWREFKHAKIVEQKWRKWTFGFSIAAIFISALSAATAVYTSFFTLTQSHKDTSSIVADSDTSTDISPQSDPIDVAEQAEK